MGNETKAIAPWVEAHRELTSDRGKGELRAALPKHLSEDQLLRSFVTAVRADKSGKLQRCSKPSLIEGVMLAAQLGLSLAPAMGQAYLVPHNNKVRGPGGDRWVLEATFIPGYRGLIALAYQSGVVTKIVARTVHENDNFHYSYGLHEALEHVPAEKNRGRPVKSYAVAWLRTGGEPIFVVCEEEDIARARGASKSRGGPWDTDEAAMMAKTAARRLSKLIPLSAEDRASQALAQAVHLDDLLEAGQQIPVTPETLVGVEQIPSEPATDPFTAPPADTNRPDPGHQPDPDVSQLAELFDEIEAGGQDPIAWYEQVRGDGPSFGDLTDADVPRLRELLGR